MRRSVLFIILVCLSCQKTKFRSCPEYDRIAGEWKSIDGDLESQLVVQKNGKVVLHSGVERGVKFISSTCFINQNLIFHAYNMDFRSIVLRQLNHKDETMNAIAIGYNATFDTLLKSSGAINPEPGSLEQSVRFIRK